MQYEPLSLIGILCKKISCANKKSGMAIKNEKETAQAIDKKWEKNWVWELNKIWNRSKDTSEKIITYNILETRSRKLEL